MTFLYPSSTNFKDPVITMGTFDGVHIGHKVLLQEVVHHANKKNVESVVITYITHPLETINQAVFPYLLTEKDKKIQLIKSLGIDHVLFLNFDQHMASMSAEMFLKDILITKLHPSEIIVGHDTHFGHSREGNYALLLANADMFHYRAYYINPIMRMDKIISSSRIRECLRTGNLSEANECLGYQYSITGKVIAGKAIGRKIGFPTINLQMYEKNKLLPANGVYFSSVHVNNKYYYALTNIGYSPTIKHSPVVEIESFLFDFSGDLYNQQIELVFFERLRDEIAFNSIEEMVLAIEKDVMKAELYIKSSKYNIEERHGAL